jgi:trans-aconitate methyltransferase
MIMAVAGPKVTRLRACVPASAGPLGHTGPVAFLDEQRLAFGLVAELYDRARPSYPATAVDDVIAHGRLSAGDRVLEVGAGTGKATVLLAQRGLQVLALEPSASMAALARAHCEGLAEVEVVETEFESWRAMERYAALVSVQAWHWIAPETRYERAYAALAPGGTLAAIWTFPDWSACSLRDALGRAYALAAPGLAPDFPMHPQSAPTRLAGDWPAEVDASGRFADPEMTVHVWSQSYSSAQYVELLQTHQDHILLAAPERRRLLAAVTEAIDSHGAGTLMMPFVTLVCLAKRR